MPAAFEPPKRFFKKNTTEPQLEAEPEEPTDTINLSDTPRWYRRRKFWLVLAVILFVIVGALSLPLGYAYWYVSSFAQAGDTSVDQLLTTVKTGWNQTPIASDNHVNFLILGLDEIHGQKEGSLLTDTMIVTSYDLDSNQIEITSLPRDLWLDPYKTKINAIYYYGELSDEITGAEFAADVIQEITNLDIHHVMVLKLDYLEELINILGGVEIDVPVGFSDEKFPRSDVDVTTVTDPNLLYETIIFKAGPQKMDGVTALKYIRSRQSSNLEEGTDLARSKRQQLLIEAIIKKLKQKEVLTNPLVLGSVYNWIEQNLTSESYPLTQFFSLAKQTEGRIPQIITKNISVQEDNQTGIIYHPETEKYDQWVYEPVDPTWEEFHAFFSE